MSEPAAAEAPPPKKANPMVAIGVAVVALLAGVGLGLKVVGPMVKGAAPAAADAPAEGGGEHGGEAEGSTAAAPEIVAIGNLIVNPQGSMGTRYLIVSIAFEVGDKEAKDKLTRADVPLRDALIRELEKETLESLGRPGAREALKGTFARIAKQFVPKTTKLVVYVPQFLIQ